MKSSDFFKKLLSGYLWLNLEVAEWLSMAESGSHGRCGGTVVLRC